MLVKCATASYDHKLGIGLLNSRNHLGTLTCLFRKIVPEAYQDTVALNNLKQPPVFLAHSCIMAKFVNIGKHIVHV